MSEQLELTPSSQAPARETGAVEKHPPSVQAAPAKSGEELKWRGVAKAFVHRPEALALLRRAVNMCERHKREFTAEDVWGFAYLLDMNKWDFRYLIGGVLAADDWEKVRQVKATHPEAHGRPIWVWRRKRRT